MKSLKMDRTVTSKSSFSDADDHISFYKDKTLLERLNYACEIINSIFSSTPNQKVDRKIISARKNAKSV